MVGVGVWLRFVLARIGVAWRALAGVGGWAEEAESLVDEFFRR